MDNNVLKIIFKNAIKDNSMSSMSEKLDIASIQVRRLRKGESVMIDSNKLLEFIYEYMTQTKKIIKS
ncbi:Uncharacterised protein [Clostridium carnis]|uniref:Uncharacterized protein n=1 Tax=Clostridium carnis TaxID=1530 RepID=A0ABY6SY29_9CLOT|nr:hypothetical protein [Clostridium carnis]VDG73400.1 Uncharacterised protein [Clostridium carnis]